MFFFTAVESRTTILTQELRVWKFCVRVFCNFFGITSIYLVYFSIQRLFDSRANGLVHADDGTHLFFFVLIFGLLTLTLSIYIYYRIFFWCCIYVMFCCFKCQRGIRGYFYIIKRTTIIITISLSVSQHQFINKWIIMVCFQLFVIS